MSIKNLTDNLVNEMPRQGQLRKGEPKPQNSKRPGKDLTYFRFVSNDPNIQARFDEIYGEQPRIINCHLAFPDLERNFPTWNEEWGAGSLKHRCNGETMVLWQDKNGLYRTEPEPCPYAELPQGDPGRKCRQTGLLRIIIDELIEFGWGYVDVVTGGKWDCIQLTKNVLDVMDMARRASSITGRPIEVQGIPCQLKREPRMTSCPSFNEDGKRQRQEKWMLYLYVHPTYIQRLMKEMNTYSLPIIDLPRLEMPTGDLEVDYPVINGNDVEMVEAEIVDDEIESEPPINGNGPKFYREDFVARIKELMQQAEELGEPMEVDQVILDEGSTEDLKQVGYKLREHVDELLVQAELVQDEIPF